jgi:glycosyltransferase involved in cell wall biosynthesis
VRIALINDGMYPYRPGVGGTWCHRLVRGLPEHAFHLVTVGDAAPPAPVYYPPTNTLTLTAIAIGGPTNAPKRGRAALEHRRPATHAAVLLCRSMLEDTPHSVAMFRSALRRLAIVGTDGAHPLGGAPLSGVLLDAWQAAHHSSSPSPGTTPPRTALPEPTQRDATDAAHLLERAIRPLSTPMPLTELNHAADAGLAALVALGAKWRTGTPFVLTEHQSYLQAPLLDQTAGRPAVRAVLLRFFRALARLAYAEASKIVVPADPLRRWVLDHNAAREKVSVVPYGVDPHSCPAIRGEPAEPILTWLGPERDLATMFSALTRVRAGQPGTRLIVAGPAAEVPREHTEVVNFLGPVTHRRSAYSTGQVVVISSADPAMPYALIESMMCGRPTICVDEGTLKPMVGMGATIVPPDDADALAAACITLLGARDRRRQLSIAAAQRARNLYGLRMLLDRFREIYEMASHDTSAPTERLVPVLPQQIAL